MNTAKYESVVIWFISVFYLAWFFYQGWTWGSPKQNCLTIYFTWSLDVRRNDWLACFLLVLPFVLLFVAIVNLFLFIDWPRFVFPR